MVSFALGGPWFRRHPVAASAVIAALIIAVTWLRFTTGDERDATTLLYALPVTLAAMTFGRRTGTTVAAGCVALLSSWLVATHEALSVIGWAARAIPILLLGVLIGTATDALDSAATAQVQLAVAAARRRDAAEVQDEIIQRLAVAKWQVESLGGDHAAELLSDAMVASQNLVQSLMADSADPLVTRCPDPGVHASTPTPPGGS